MASQKEQIRAVRLVKVAEYLRADVSRIATTALHHAKDQTAIEGSRNAHHDRAAGPPWQRGGDGPEATVVAATDPKLVPDSIEYLSGARVDAITGECKPLSSSPISRLIRELAASECIFQLANGWSLTSPARKVDQAARRLPIRGGSRMKESTN